LLFLKIDFIRQPLQYSTFELIEDRTPTLFHARAFLNHLFKEYNTMKLNPYLMFNGQGKAALKFYEQCLGAKIEAMMTYGESPMAPTTPPESRHSVRESQFISQTIRSPRPKILTAKADPRGSRRLLF
jgi:hypothetical protein